MLFNESDEGDSFTIQESQAGGRLDKILAAHYQTIGSRTYFQMLIDKELVLLNGAAVKKRAKPIMGDAVEVFFIQAPEVQLTPQEIPLAVLFEDDDIIIVNKPPGMVIHPAPGHWDRTFVNALLYHCGYMTDLSADSSLRPGIVHRLDKETSGVLIAAKTLKAQQLLIEMFAARQIYKEYWAICLGNPGNCEINMPIGRHPIHRKQMSIREDGKYALTYCETLRTSEDLSLVKVILATGRTHQIRVHLKHRGTPILGDPVYGSKQANLRYGQTRQQLHAKRVLFSHPLTQQKIEIEAPLPSDMEECLSKRFR